MPNSILTPLQITRGAGTILHNSLRFTRNIDRSYDSQFAKEGAKIGDTLRLRNPNMYLVSSGPNLAVQDTNEISVNLVVSKQRHVDTNFSTAELTLSVQDFMRRIGEPAMTTLASYIDNDAMNMIFDTWQQVGTPGTIPSTARVLLDANAKMSLVATPMSPRYVGIDPVTNAALVDGLKGLFNPQGSQGSQYRDGVVQNGQLGYREMFVTQSTPTLITGSRNTAYTTAVAATTTLGQATLPVITGAGTISRGEVFTISGVYAVNPETKKSTGQLLQFTVTTDYAGGAGTLDIQPALYKSGPRQNFYNAGGDLPNSTALVFAGSASTSYPVSIAYHRDAFAMATADLVLPEGVDQAAREEQDGISLRYVRQYRIGTDDIPARFDVLYGNVARRGEMACRIIGGF